MSDILDFNGATTLDLDPDKILESAKGKLDTVVIIGWDKNDMLYMSSSTGEIEAINYLIDLAKSNLIER